MSSAELVDLPRKNAVAILYTLDSMNALNFMPYAGNGYLRPLQQFHRILYQKDVGTDFVDAHAADFTGYKLLIVPALYVADDALLAKITDFVRHGGHVVMTLKSGYTNDDGMVRPLLAPGPLRAAAGISYQEVSTLTKPLRLKGDPFGTGDEASATTIAEFLRPEPMKAVMVFSQRRAMRRKRLSLLKKHSTW